MLIIINSMKDSAMQLFRNNVLESKLVLGIGKKTTQAQCAGKQIMR